MLALCMVRRLLQALYQLVSFLTAVHIDSVSTNFVSSLLQCSCFSSKVQAPHIPDRLNEEVVAIVVKKRKDMLREKKKGLGCPTVATRTVLEVPRSQLGQ